MCCEALKRLAFNESGGGGNDDPTSVEERHTARNGYADSDVMPNPHEIHRMSKLFVENILGTVMSHE